MQADCGAIEIQLFCNGDEAFELPGVERRRSDGYRSLSRVMRSRGDPVAAIVGSDDSVRSENDVMTGYQGRGHPPTSSARPMLVGRRARAAAW